MMNILKDWYCQAEDHLQDLKKACFSNVVRLERSTTPMYHPDPTYFARHGLSRGRKVEGQPPDIDFCCYGFDDKDRLAHASEIYTQTLYLYDGEVVRIVTYNDDIVVHVGLLEYEGEKLRSFKRFGEGYGPYYVYSEMVFHYRGNQIVRLEEDYRVTGRAFPESWDGRSREYTFHYDDNGTISKILCRHGSSREVLVVYDIRDPRVSIADELSRRLARATVEKIIELDFREPVFYLGMSYSFSVDSPLSSTCMALGTVRERDEMIEKYNRNEIEIIWDPGEYEHFHDAFRMDDTLQELVDFIDLEYALTNNETLVISLLNRTARKLLEYDWTGILKTDPDFAVLAVEEEGFGFEENVREILPIELRKRLMQKGYI